MDGAPAVLAASKPFWGVVEGEELGEEKRGEGLARRWDLVVASISRSYHLASPSEPDTGLLNSLPAK